MSAALRSGCAPNVGEQGATDLETAAAQGRLQQDVQAPEGSRADYDGDDEVEAALALVARLSANTAAAPRGPAGADYDFGLGRLAAHFGQGAAVALFWDGAAREAAGEFSGAAARYSRAFRLWPQLDSCPDGGVPRGVREAARAAGLACDLEAVVDVAAARRSRVVCARGLLTAADVAAVEGVRARVAAAAPGGARDAHDRKVCTFLDDTPAHAMRAAAPKTLGKLLRFGERAWAAARWGGDADSPGPLNDVRGGLPALSIRVVEHWDYAVGGGLVDDAHYDVDSIVTVVALLHGAETGGVLRTHEADGTQLEHSLEAGDAVAFVSHKYHNITPVTAGTRRSLVVELWQGRTEHAGR